MMTMAWPLWFLLLVVGAANWPIVLTAAVILLLLAALTRGWLRWIALVASLPCLAIIAFAAWSAINGWQRDAESDEFEVRTHQVLDRDQEVSGLKLPAGTELQWWDVDHRELRSAYPPTPMLLFGMHVSLIGRDYKAPEWELQLSEPGTIDGWTCERTNVGVLPDGKLQSCKLAAGRVWKDWPIPAGSWLDLKTTGKVGLTLPTGASMAAPEIGHRITDTGGFAFNADGSLDNFYFDEQNPLAVAGRRLYNTVEWTYDPASYGQGRRRHAVTVRGIQMLDNGEGSTVVIRLSDGKVTIPD